jgi:hypothetical protein
MPADPPRVLAANIGTYSELIDAFRARAVERHIAITNPAVAQLAGLPDAYPAKVLALNPVKRIGMISLGPLLAILGCRLILVEDLEAVKMYDGRIPKRNEAFVHATTMEIKFSRRKWRQIQTKGRRTRWDSMTAKQRSAYARKLNRIRWANGGKANGVSVKP